MTPQIVRVRDRLMKTRPALWLRHVVWRTAGIALFAAGVALLFGKIVEDLLRDETRVVDVPVRAWVQSHRSPSLDVAIGTLTWLGSVAVLVPFVAVLAAWLWHRRGRRLAAVVLPAPAVAVVLIVGLKHLFSRMRPPGALLVPGLGYSFPSGHATGATAVAFTIAYVAAREGLFRSIPAFTIATVVMLVVGFSRVYLDVHWATDVAAGWALGLLVAALSAALYERLATQRREGTLTLDDAGASE